MNSRRTDRNADHARHVRRRHAGAAVLRYRATGLTPPSAAGPWLGPSQASFSFKTVMRTAFAATASS